MITAGNGPSCSGWVTNVSMGPDGVSMATTRSLMTPDLPSPAASTWPPELSGRRQSRRPGNDKDGSGATILSRWQGPRVARRGRRRGLTALHSLTKGRWSAMPDDAPKTAYELAMERLRRKDRDEGAVERALTDDQKTAIAEVRRVYEARVAEREILHRDALGKARSREEIARLNDELAQDHERFVSERDRKIADIRARPD